MLVHNVDIHAGTDTVSRFQFMEMVACKIPSKWNRVGVSLGMDQSQLDAIDQHRRGDRLECFSDVFTYWQQQSTPQSPANWATLVTVLRSNYVGAEVLSDTIQNTYVIDTQSSPPTGKHALSAGVYTCWFIMLMSVLQALIQYHDSSLWKQ